MKSAQVFSSFFHVEKMNIKNDRQNSEITHSIAESKEMKFLQYHNEKYNYIWFEGIVSKSFEGYDILTEG